MGFHVYSFLLVLFLILSLARLGRLCWLLLQPSHSRGGVKRTTLSRLLKPRCSDDCPACRLASPASPGVEPAFAPIRHSGRPPARYQGNPLTLFQRSPAEPDWHLSAHPALPGGSSTGIGLARHPPHPLGCVHLPLRPFPLSQALPRAFEYYGRSVTLSLAAFR